MNLLLMPMWFLSGAVFPVDSAPAWMRAVMWANPLTYGQAAVSGTLLGDTSTGGVSATIPIVWAVGVLLLCTATSLALAARVVARPRKDGRR